MDYKELIEKLEGGIREGNTKQVLEKVKSLNFEKIPRRFRQQLANKAWRSGGVKQGMRILHPVVYSEKALLRKDSSPLELIEYSMLLQKLGSTKEALDRLETLDTSRFPQVLLYKSFCLFSNWSYKESLKHLNEYVSHSAVNDYQILVGFMNLLSAHLCLENISEAEKVKEEIIRLDIEAHKRLLGSFLEMSAQIEMLKSNNREAQKLLKRSEKALENESGSYLLFTKKWQAIITANESHSTKPLENLRKLALEKNHWETLREIDLYSLPIDFDQNRFFKLLYGTPYEAYQSRIINTLRYNKPLPERCQIDFGGTANFDLSQFKFEGAELSKPGQNIHKLFYCLTSDLYKPLRIGTIFSSLFPDEYFNIFSTPNKIHQLVNRARKLIAKEKLPCHIDESHEGYKVQFSRNCSISLDLNKKIPSQESLMWKKLLSNEQSEWSRAEIMEILGLSLTSSNRFLSWCLEEKFLERFGSGKNTKYRRLTQTSLLSA